MCKRPLPADQRGASMIEATMVLTLLFLVMLTFIDGVRYMSARAVLLKGAQLAANLAAKKANFDIDGYALNPIDADNAATADGKKFGEFKEARRTVTSLVVDFATAQTRVLSSADKPSMMRMQTFKSYDLVNNRYIVDNAAPLLVLRPSECGKRADGSEICHPLRCPAASGGNTFNCDAPKRAASERMDSMLKQMPIMVVVRGTMQGVSPIFREVPIEVRAMAWREAVVNQGFKEAVEDPDSSVVVPPLSVLPDPSEGDGLGPQCSSPSSCGPGYQFDGCFCTGAGG